MKRYAVRALAIFGCAVGGGCIEQAAPARTSMPQKSAAAPVSSFVTSPARSATHAPPLPSSPPAPPAGETPRLPLDVVPGRLTRVPLPNYRAAAVFHGEASTRRALVYLHGVCGNVDKIRDWAEATSARVTTVALYGNKSCPTTATRFSWNQDIEFIHLLIQTALSRVYEVRGGLLETRKVVLFGYSQGASRAERLAARYPEHYPWVILGGPPALPHLSNLAAVERTALLVGSEEHHARLRETAAMLDHEGAPTRFDVFEGVGHGAFGPSAPAVMDRTLAWLLSE